MARVLPSLRRQLNLPVQWRWKRPDVYPSDKNVLGRATPVWLLVLPFCAAAQDNTIATLPVVTVEAIRMDTAPVQTPASVDVVAGSQIRARQPGIHLSEGLENGKTSCRGRWLQYTLNLVV